MNIPAEKLIPHRPPMRFIEALTDCTVATARGTACFSFDHFAVANGLVLESALVECVAQTAAAWLGYRASCEDKPPAVGMLAAVTDFQFYAAAHNDAQLIIEVRELKHLGPMRLVSGSITCKGQRIAEGELTIYA